MNLFWAPGMSDSAREVLDHMTRWEKAALAGLTFLFGVFAFAIPVVIMSSIMGPGAFLALPEGFAFPVVFCLVAVFWLIISLRRRLLLGSQFAKDKGLTWADINARQPFSRRETLIVGGVFALAMAITLATALFAFLAFSNAA